MFSQTWKKYLPLIALFLKKSATGPQRVQLNQTDFERALGGRKLKLSFARMEINNGRFNNLLKNTALAQELADVLLDDAVVKSYLRTRKMSFAFSAGNELLITDETPVPVAEELLEAEAVATGEPETNG